MPKYPDIYVQLVGMDGNAMSIIGRVSQALRRAKVPQSEIDQYLKEAMSGDYNNLLNVTMDWVNCDCEEDDDDESYDDDEPDFDEEEEDDDAWDESEDDGEPPYYEDQQPPFSDD